MTIERSLQQFIESTLDPEQRTHCRWLVGYSGGLDSHLLLHCLSTVVAHFDGVVLQAIHVNHQLQAQAEDWEQHCQSKADQLNVPLRIERVNVEVNHSAGLEAAAREARYRVFKANLGENDVLFLAHHQDDQAETLLLRLMRGSGATGLSAMASSSQFETMRILRPLLGTSRVELEQQAEQRQLHWIEDPSNNDVRHDRNFIRRDIMPLLKSRWPTAAGNIARSAELLRIESQQLEVLLQPLYDEAVDDQLRINNHFLQSLPEVTQGQLIRYWLKRLDLPYPSQVNLRRIIDEVLGAPKDGQPLVRWGSVEVRRYDGWLYGMKAQTVFDSQQALQWVFPETLHVEGLGCVTAEKTQAGGLRMPAGDQEQVTLKFRQGGEKCRPFRKGKNRPLKKLMHEYQIPPWLRDRTPLVYYGDQLVAVVGAWVCEEYAVLADQAGYRLTLIDAKD
ncbi:MAG: tRNA lysidine(34) synthetase TilS [Moraxellaceae bacterium]|nr:MAG: tRNA lysidine(34) synthetase TilS [Moraxellaceae bacterium]